MQHWFYVIHCHFFFVSYLATQTLEAEQSQMGDKRNVGERNIAAAGGITWMTKGQTDWKYLWRSPA